MLLSPMTNCPDEPRHLIHLRGGHRGSWGGLCSSFGTPGGKGGVLPRGGWVAGAGRAPRVKGGSAPPLRKLGFVEGGPEAAKIGGLSPLVAFGRCCRRQPERVCGYA